MIEKSYEDSTKTMTFTLPKQGYSNIEVKPVDESLIPPDGISFYLMKLDKVVVVRPKADFYISRSVPSDGWYPQVDFGELDGLATSVSRRHAVIHPLQRGYEIMDLHSTNGTTLNDFRLVPDKAYPLVSGALLSIGREQVMVIYRLSSLYP